MRRLAAVLIVLGLALSGYLLHRHFALAHGAEAAGRGVCSTVLRLDCDAALTSKLASFAGISLAGWGIVYFGTLVALLAMAEPLGEPFRTAARRAALALAVLASVAGVGLAAAMVFGAAPFCPLCALIHAIDIALAVVLARDAGVPFRQAVREMGSAAATVVRIATDGATRLARIGFLAVGAIALVLFQTVSLLEMKNKPEPPDPRFSVAAFASTRRYVIPEDERDVRIGPAEAPDRLVVFTDFECVGCKQYSKAITKQAGHAKSRVSVVFKHFPACRSCNPAVREDRHPMACASALAAEAARMQGKFHEFHDALFASAQPHTEEDLVRLAKETGLDLDRFNADRAGDEARKKVADDVELGNRLGVDETPCVFLNGRRAPDVKPATMFLLTSSENANRPVPVPEPKPAKNPSPEESPEADDGH
jgi:protein-disulfide isomerase/uncharacterized membrane protein